MNSGHGFRQRKPSKARVMLWWILAILYPIIIILGSLRPEFGAETTRQVIERLFPSLSASSVHRAVVVVRKSGHVIGYGLFSVILSNVLISIFARTGRRQSVVLSVALAAAVALGVAVLDETLQVKAVFRSGNSQDVGIDLIGIVLASILKLGAEL